MPFDIYSRRCVTQRCRFRNGARDYFFMRYIRANTRNKMSSKSFSWRVGILPYWPEISAHRVCARDLLRDLAQPCRFRNRGGVSIFPSLLYLWDSVLSLGGGTHRAPLLASTPRRAKAATTHDPRPTPRRRRYVDTNAVRAPQRRLLCFQLHRQPLLLFPDIAIPTSFQWRSLSHDNNLKHHDPGRPRARFQ